MEKLTRLDTFRADMICDECNAGKMKPTGECLDSHPPLYPHVCEECGSKKSFRTTYPDYRQVEVEHGL